MFDDSIQLPSYLDHPPEVAEYFQEIEKRRVVLGIEHLGRVFEGGETPVVALSDVNFQVRQREFISVIGPSGCGKSTLIRIVAGLEEPSSGVVAVDGIPVTGPGADRGMVFQNYTLFPWLTVRKNVLFGPRMKGIRADKADKAADEWLKLVGLSDFAELYPAQLSGGMKQRVAIARALANDPRILLMDEPFGALDAQTRCSMQAHLLRIWSAADVTVLFITHDLEEAIYLSDRIVVLGARPGRILEIIDVPVPRPRSQEQFLSAHFLATKKRLEELIHGRNPGADADGELLHD
ncbi:MAG TPA: ABC transporter ATP-binding protein [Polyangiaceae bacterium]|jgi:NitT/TauT family transport system ATP-binding protein|nr:ABC transporter ATP-binding protein [Polyangiaceae bacterium]